MLTVKWCGQLDYLAALTQQHMLVAERKQNRNLADQLLLMEHLPTYTLGSSGKEENLLLSPEALLAEGISVHHVNRGGDITYHGPGQLVGYPILNLKALYTQLGLEKVSLHGYMRDLEEVIIQAIKPFGLDGWRYPGYTGVWVGDREDDPRKIAAIGIHVSSRWISSHGFALNVNPNMTHFEHIVPCGISEHAVTSMSQELKRDIAITELCRPIVAAFEQIFKVEILELGFTPDLTF